MKHAHRHPLRHLALAALLALAGNAWACKYASWVYTPDQYLARNAPGTVAFEAEVIDVRELAARADGTREFDIRLRATRWWRGTARDTLRVKGYANTMPGSSCQGTQDFHPAKGERWIILGEEMDGEVRVAPLASRRFENGKLPAAHAAALGAGDKSRP